MNRTVILTALRAVMPGVEMKDSLFEGMNSFIFDGKWLKTYNDNISVSLPFESDVKAAVKATEFYNAASKMSGMEISLVVDGGRLVATDMKTTLSMNIMDDDKVVKCIESMQLEDIEWHDVPEGFIRGAGLCSFSISNDPAFGVLNFLRVEDDKLVSSDNFRASVFGLPVSMESFSISRQAVKELVKIPEIKQYGVGMAWVHFRNANGATFSLRRVVDTYPTKQIVELFDGEKSKEYKFPDGLAESVERVSVFSSRDSDSDLEFITMQRNGKALVVSGERVHGSIEDKLPLIGKDTFPDIRISISPKFLRAILGVSNTFCILNGSLILFRGDGFSHVISLMKTE